MLKKKLYNIKERPLNKPISLLVSNMDMVNKVAKDMIETCEKALNISIQPYIEEIEVALPPTFSRYLNTPLGTPYGYMLDMWDSMIPRTLHYVQDQPFDNFLFCGASQERGDGYGCAYHTGEKAAKLTIKAFKEGK